MNQQHKKNVKIKKIIKTKLSIASVLKQNGKIDQKFELMFNRLSLEEIIALKLELSSKAFTKGKFFSLPILSAVGRSSRFAVIKAANSMFYSDYDASRFLGTSIWEFRKLKEWIRNEKFIYSFDNKRSNSLPPSSDSIVDSATETTD